MCTERFYKNHLKLGTHFTNIRKKIANTNGGKLRKTFFIPSNLIKKDMNYYCCVCDETIKLKSKNNHPNSPRHNHLEKTLRTNHTINIPKFSNIDKMFNDYITNHDKIFFCFFKCDSKLDLII